VRPELFEKTYRLRKYLQEITINIEEDITEKEVLKKWFPYTPEKKYLFSIAEDGSFNKKHYLGFYLYSVAGYAVGFKENGETVEEFAGDIGITVIKKTDVVDSYLKMLMFLLELKALLRLAEREKPPVLILDGTLSGRFITFFPKTDWFTSEEFEGKLAKLASEYIPVLKENLLKEDITAFSDTFRMSLEEKLVSILGKKGERRDVIEAALSKVAYFEYLLLLYKLFYGLEWNPLIIGIAKTSHNTEIFNRPIPDIRLFYKYIDGTGYSPGFYINLEEKKWEFSEIFDYIEKEISTGLKDTQIRYFYGKYDKGKHISLIEVYENPLRETPDIEEILDILSYYSVNGYPFLLKKADNEVRITFKDMEIIENLLGLRREVHGREVLK
jgi:NurA-like 5'-3' nuclease